MTNKITIKFSTALDNMVHARSRIRRIGWPDFKFLYLVDGSTFTVSRPPLDTIYPTGSTVTYRPHIDIQYAPGNCGVWSPTQEDMLADDWLVA